MRHKKGLILLFILGIFSITQSACNERHADENSNKRDVKVKGETEWLFPENKQTVKDFLKSVYAGDEKVTNLSVGVFFSDAKMPNFIFKEGSVPKRREGLLKAKEIIKDHKLDFLRIPWWAIIDVDGKQVMVQERLKIDSTNKMDDRYEEYFAEFDNNTKLHDRFKEMFEQLAIFVVATHYNDAKINNLPLLQDGSKIAIVDFDSLGEGYAGWEPYAGAKALFLGGIDNNMAGRLHRTFAYPEFFASMNNVVKSKLSINLPWDKWGVSLKDAADYRARELADRKHARDRLNAVRQHANFLNAAEFLSLKNKIQQKIDADVELNGLTPGILFDKNMPFINFLERIKKPLTSDPLKLTRFDFRADGKNMKVLDTKPFLDISDKLARLVFTVLEEENIIAGFTVDTLNGFRDKKKILDKNEYTWDRIIVYF